ncbi:MAG: ATP-binding protein [Opitutales bacterium]|nr:ATP-binding protein [Opitutales bacterium]
MRKEAPISMVDPALTHRKKWRNSLVVRIPLIFLGLLLLLISSFFVLMEFWVKDYLEDQTYQSIEKSGDAIVSKVKGQIHATEALAISLARLGETIFEDSDYSRKQLSSLIDHNESVDIIAGGGIWPEPWLFDPALERRSFFWGRNSKGLLEYYDDYNDPEGNGYHNEEWYVPAKYLKNRKVFWSKSYMDPYSMEPMVTCTAPMYRDGLFYGVATIDIKLSGMNQLLERITQAQPGYAFAVDRNGKFLSFPKEYQKHPLIREKEYIKASDLAEMDPEFLSISESIKDVSRRSDLSLWTDEMLEEAKSIASESYQIAEDEAKTISFMLHDPVTHGESSVRQFVSEADILVDGRSIVSIYLVPETFWKIVLVSEYRHFHQRFREFYQSLLFWIVVIFVIATALALAVIYRSYISPLAKVQTELEAAVENKEHKAVYFSTPRQDELGTLVHWLNLRSNLLNQTLEKLSVANEEAQKANQAKSEFLATMTHEIRTPLNGITGFAKLMEETHLSKEQKEYTEAIISNSDSLLFIVEDILDLSKIESNKLELEMHPFDLRECVEDVCGIIEPQAKIKGLEYQVIVDEMVPVMVNGDSSRIRQILMNLCSNAVKFTLEGCVSLKVSLAEEKASDSSYHLLKFEVKDTGIGISQENAKKLFSPFTQADTSTYRKFGGSGLGLVICKRLVEGMNGEITLNSEIGVGSSFTFTIEVKKIVNRTTLDRGKKKEKVGQFSEWGKLYPTRILVAEDNLINQKLIGKILQKMGYDPHFVVNGVEVLNRLEVQHYDLILMDNLMPEMDGIEATKQIRSGKINKDQKNIDIVAVTANAFEQARIDAYSAGMDGFLAKPVRVQKLAESIRKLYELRIVFGSDKEQSKDMFSKREF